MTTERQRRGAGGNRGRAAAKARTRGGAGAVFTEGRRPGPDAGVAAPRARRPVAAGLLLVALAGAWAYANSYAGVLVLDDVRAIAQNATIRRLWPLPGPLSPQPASTVAGRPIANLSFAINYAMAPADARDAFQPPPGGATDPAARDRLLRNLRGYHQVNLLVHLAAALALAGVVRRTLASPVLAGRFGRHAAPLAAAVALIWVTHPLQTSAVTYLVQRVESLASLFSLLTLYFAIRAWQARRHGAAWGAAAVACCALGMGTKEVAVTAPILVAAWGWLFARPGGEAAVSGGGAGPAHGQAVPRRRWPLVASLAATWGLLAALVAREHRAPSLALAWDASWQYLLTQAEVIVHYLRLAVVPSPLVFLYTWPLRDSLAAVWWQAALLTALVALTAVGLARRRPIAFPGAWFFLVLAPSSSLLPIVTEVAAEHRMYLPLAAPIACAVIGAYLGGQWALRKVDGPFRGRASRAGWPAAAAVALAVAVALGSATRDRNRDYESDVRLWADTVAKQPANGRARVAYGSVLAAAGQLADAEAQFRAAASLDSRDAIARARLGSILVLKGDTPGAVRELEQALALRPDDPDAHRWLGQAYAATGDERRAVTHLERAVQLIGPDPSLLGRLATILAQADDPAVRDGLRAVALAERAVEATARREPLALAVLAVAQASAGRFGEAAATAAEGVPLAGAQGHQALAADLERRASVYRSRAEQGMRR